MSYLVAISLAALLGGSVPALAKFALAVIPTFSLLFIRFFVACMTLLPLIVRSKELNGNKVIQATKNLMNNKENVGITARANLAKAGTLPPSNAAREIASKYGIVYLSLS